MRTSQHDQQPSKGTRHCLRQSSPHLRKRTHGSCWFLRNGTTSINRSTAQGTPEFQLNERADHLLAAVLLPTALGTQDIHLIIRDRQLRSRDDRSAEEQMSERGLLRGWVVKSISRGRTAHTVSAGHGYGHERRHLGGGGGGGTGTPQSFQRLILCPWTLHGKNRLQMVLVPPPNRPAVAPPLATAIGHGPRTALERS